jgi:hypothetical protein
MPPAFERFLHGEISRRQFVRRSAVAVAGLAGFELLRGTPAFAKPRLGSAPRPIPGGFAFPDFEIVPTGADLHVIPPVPGLEMSTITDFNGQIAAAEIQGTATDGRGKTFGFDTDMRFMDGEYIGSDGRAYHGTFGFI